MLAYEITDTFGGEANYCWVNRGEITAKTKRGQVKQLKALMGVTGERCEVSGSDGDLTVRPVGKHAPCIVGFVHWDDGPDFAVERGPID